MAKKSKNTTRRRFLKTAAAVPAPMVVAAHVLGRGAYAAPSDRVTVGFIGAGRRALTWHQPKLMVETVGLPNAKIVAVAEADKRQLAQGKEFVDKSYGNSDCATYSDFREMLDRKDIDAIFAATPHHWHGVMTVMGCQAGKDVYSEKPLSLTIREAVRMAEDAKKYSRIVQGGTQARSSPTISFAMEQIRKGAIGDVKTVQVGCWGQARFMDITAEPIPDYLDWDMFVGPAKMCPYSKIRWSGRREFSGGVITDWGHHFFDVAQWGLGMDESGPVEVFPAGGDHEFVTLRYSNGAEIQLHAKNGKALSTGTTFIGSQGKIYTQAWEDYVEFEPKELGLAYLKAHKLKVPEGLPTDQKTLAVQVDGSVPPKEHDDFSDNGTGLHVANFIDCVKTRKPSNADVQLSRRSVTLAHLVNISLWENRPLKWDPEKFEFPGDDKANSYIHIEPRAPWKL